MSERNAPETLTIGEVFAAGRHYRVPVYQRSYAWTEVEVSTLLADVRRARLRSKALESRGNVSDYYLGAMVVNRTQTPAGDQIDEVVDGQQRLTTLTVLAAVAEQVTQAGVLDPVALAVLDYEGRAEAGEDLATLRRRGGHRHGAFQVEAIGAAVETIATACRRAMDRQTPADDQEVVFDGDDLAYLWKHVRLLRTELPKGTDLNHYFEVMNTRGEQLAKHEILKATLMRPLQDATDRKVFAHVWDACAVLDRHIQLQFSTERPKDGGEAARDAVFGGSWSALLTRDFASLRAALAPSQTATASGARTIIEALLAAGQTAVESGPSSDQRQDDADTGAYGTIVDFPNLLLHVLRVMQEKGEGDEPGLPRWGQDSTGAVRLEDGSLLEQFAQHGQDDAAWSQRFLVTLLRMRLLLDTYVIRTLATTGTQADEENWVLSRAQKLETESGERSPRRRLGVKNTFQDPQVQDAVRNLQAMFQVTDTRRTSKYFLYRILRWLDAQPVDGVDGVAFQLMLEDLARERLRAYEADKTWDAGVNVPNFVFNALDYILWDAGRTSPMEREHLREPLSDVEQEVLRRRADAFRFRYRTSVEHFYPVVPGEEQEALTAEDVNRFGNLCIMGRRENSQRNNLMPVSKVKQYSSDEQSLKFQLMAGILHAEGDWDVPQIKEHGNSMRRVIQEWQGKRP
ncbi:GmrSD restriction endonuclease domain-containing protein [Micrococcus luteus]|uniref:GmrSD restriction endonuclease domain-containing protein n=2 Tax=Actinomycetes TaxID=1760 RepID=UPI0037CA6B5E